MPITYEIDRRSLLMVTHMTGQITSSEAFDYLDAIVADPENDQCDELIILEDVDFESITSSDVRSLARRASENSHDDQFRVAVVAPRDADFGIWRMFQSLRDLGENRMAVFRDIDDAREWLGIKAN